MSVQGEFRSVRFGARAISALEAALRAAVMEAHVCALNEIDVALRRSGEDHCPLGLVRNLTTNLARNRRRNIRPCPELDELMAA